MISGLYYKHITIVNDDTSVMNKFESSLTGKTRVVIYHRHMFIVQATDGLFTALHFFLTYELPQ
jgi:hypothetical protein